MRILILGKGYIGNYLAKHSTNTNHEVLHYSKAELEYSNEQTFSNFLKENNPDWIINTSGYTGKPNVDACEKDAWNCYHYNVTVPLILTKVANSLNIPIIHIGSGCIYTGYKKQFTEEDPSNFGVEQINSSFYSKTKDAFEKLSQHMERYIFRIRIPFNGVPEPKNYLWKILHYENLISMPNSLTNVDELVEFTYKFIEKDPVVGIPKPGIYNVVNTDTIDAKTVVELLKQNNLTNPNWKFIDINEAQFLVERSNCDLSTNKIKDLGLKLQPILPSIAAAIQQYKRSYYEGATSLQQS